MMHFDDNNITSTTNIGCNSTLMISNLLDALEYDTYHHLDGWHRRYHIIETIYRLASYDQWGRCILYEQLKSSTTQNNNLFSRFWSCMIHTIQLRIPSHLLVPQQQPTIDVCIRMEVCRILSSFLPIVSKDKSCNAIWPIIETILIQVITEEKSSHSTANQQPMMIIDNNINTHMVRSSDTEIPSSSSFDNDRLSLSACHALYICIYYSPWIHAGNVTLSNDLFEKLLSILQIHYQMNDILDYMNDISIFMLRFIRLHHHHHHHRLNNNTNNEMRIMTTSENNNNNNNNNTSISHIEKTKTIIDRKLFLSSSPAIIEILIFILSFQLNNIEMISKKSSQQLYEESKLNCLSFLLELIKEYDDPNNDNKMIEKYDHEKYNDNTISNNNKRHIVNDDNSIRNKSYQTTIKTNLANHDRLLISLVNICQYYNNYINYNRHHNNSIPTNHQTIKDQAKYIMIQLVPEM